MKQYDYLISGSFAFDTILLHNGEFHHRILPESLAKLNVAFGVDSEKTEFGGTGGNIAYNSRLFDNNPLLVGCLGYDCNHYIQNMKSIGLDTRPLSIIETENTAHAWILTDANNNQITAFHMGAMKVEAQVNTYTPNIWHLAPSSVTHTISLFQKGQSENKIILLDPGQATPGFIADLESFIPMLEYSTGIFVNEYECELIEEKTKLPINTWVKNEKQFVIKTLGSKGLIIYTQDNEQHINTAKPTEILDPTGCGDSLRAGFLYGYIQGWSLTDCAKYGAAVASFAIEKSGGQNHKPSLTQITERAQTIL